MATHSSILAWKILWTEEPAGLQSKSSQSLTQLKRQRAHALPFPLSSLTGLSPCSKWWGEEGGETGSMVMLCICLWAPFSQGLIQLYLGCLYRRISFPLEGQPSSLQHPCWIPLPMCMLARLGLGTTWAVPCPSPPSASLNALLGKAIKNYWSSVPDTQFHKEIGCCGLSRVYLWTHAF